MTEEMSASATSDYSIVVKDNMTDQFEIETASESLVSSPPPSYMSPQTSTDSNGNVMFQSQPLTGNSGLVPSETGVHGQIAEDSRPTVSADIPVSLSSDDNNDVIFSSQPKSNNVLPNRKGMDIARDKKRILEICYGDGIRKGSSHSTGRSSSSSVNRKGSSRRSSDGKEKKSGTASSRKRKDGSSSSSSRSERKSSKSAEHDSSEKSTEDPPLDGVVERRREEKKKSKKKRSKKKKEIPVPRDNAGKVLRKRRKVKDRHHVVKKHQIKRAKDFKLGLEVFDEGENDDLSSVEGDVEAQANPKSLLCAIEESSSSEISWDTMEEGGEEGEHGQLDEDDSDSEEEEGGHDSDNEDEEDGHDSDSEDEDDGDSDEEGDEDDSFDIDDGVNIKQSLSRDDRFWRKPRFLVVLCVVIAGAIGAGIALALLFSDSDSGEDTVRLQTTNATQTPSQTPTAAPVINPSPVTPIPTNGGETAEKLRLLKEYLVEFSPDVIVSGSYQDQAAVWIAENDVFDFSTINKRLVLERYVMVLFYLATAGDLWNTRLGWMSEDSICEWHGIFCSNGFVIYILLDENAIFGSLPLELFRLTDLVLMSLKTNSLAGSLPSEIGLLSKLTGLFLDNQADESLVGPLPSEIGLLTGLKHLDLQLNGIGGPFVSEIGLLTQLTYLSVFQNSLSGAIPSQLGLLTDLITFDLSDNVLTGSIPVELTGLSKLESFTAFKNKLGGTIPESIWGMSSLKVLSLEDNSLTGFIPTTLGLLLQLAELLLTGNLLKGTIPTELGNIRSLTTITLGENELTGLVPSEIGLLTQLTLLDVSNTFLYGEIPPEVLFLINNSTLVVDSAGTEYLIGVPDLIL